MNDSENGKSVRRTLNVPPETDKMLRRLADQWDVSYTDVANVMFERGIVIEGALENGYPVVIKTPDVELRLNDDRPIRRELLEDEWAKKLKLLD